ncbi:MAG: hypothetical protein M3383_07535 [Actinomycetota bacterium]|nr:hypothetical protein [Actinomycetota bacterium]
MVACALVPRFELLAAVSERRELLNGPVALAPVPGGPQVVGAASGAAGAFGVMPGMRLAEALGRCPELALVAPDPQRAEETWERNVAKLESIGAAVESERPGEAFFGLSGLRAIWKRPEQVLTRARALLGAGSRLGAGPTRLCAAGAALRARGGRRLSPIVVSHSEARAFLDPLPIRLLCDRLTDDSPLFADTLERLGVVTVGDFATLPSSAVADRFGKPGLEALAIARGIERPLRPRTPPEELREELELPDAATGQHLSRALEHLLDRLLASPLRRGRGFRRLRIEARLAGGGGWRIDAVTRRASADRERLLLVLSPKLAALPAPASRLALRGVELADLAPGQPALAPDEGARRRDALGEAVRHARAAAGRESLLRVLEMDTTSSLPERRATLTPFEPPQ